MMKLAVALSVAVLASLGLLAGSCGATASRRAASPQQASSAQALSQQASPQATPLKPPETLQLATDSKLGTVTFSHVDHITKNRNIAGTGPVECVECHHTAQPASELLKLPPLKTAFPADRTTTLTAEMIAKDPGAVGVITCRSCHARAGEKPKTLAEIPQIKHESSAAMITLTNMQAFHRNCAKCHDEVAKNRPDAKAPTSMKCAACHKKSG
jgi:hypothetical protein